jgi:hypothetical protein
LSGLMSEFRGGKTADRPVGTDATRGWFTDLQLQLGKAFSGCEEYIRIVVQDEALIRRQCRSNFATKAPRAKA